MVLFILLSILVFLVGHMFREKYFCKLTSLPCYSCLGLYLVGLSSKLHFMILTKIDFICLLIGSDCNCFVDWFGSCSPMLLYLFFFLFQCYFSPMESLRLGLRDVRVRYLFLLRLVSLKKKCQCMHVHNKIE